MKKLLIIVLLGVMLMAHGAQDYSDVRKEEFTLRIDDMAELASRLSDTSSLHRGGEVILFEGFDDGLVKWDKTLSGTNAAFSLDNTLSASGAYSARLTGGSDSSKACYAYVTLPYLDMSTFGMETRIAIGDNVDIVYFRLDIYDGTNYYLSSIRYRPDENDVYYRSYDGTFVKLADNVVLSESDKAFDFVKLIVSGTNATYKYLIINSTKWDMSNLDLYTISSVTNPHIVMGVSVYSNTGFNGFANLDNVFVTRNEY